MGFDSVRLYQSINQEEILPPHQIRIIKQTKFTYSPLEEAIEKQIKTIEGQDEKQIETVKDYEKQLDNTNAYSCEDK